tara:strand:+ start:115 stop:606 length:492 start_codon:yes stop_codon:yes gene_type:complete
MIIVRKNLLRFNGNSYTCAIGKNGVTAEKNEGDGCTPLGEYSLGCIYFRKDKLVLPDVKLPTIAIDKNAGWCDDVASNDYNRPIAFPFKYSAERLFRDDGIYDIVCVINYNSDPVIKGKGSAIFLHIARNDYSGTEGCIALQQNDLIQLLSQINSQTRISIIV